MVSLNDIFAKAFKCTEVKIEQSAEDIPGWDSVSHLQLILIIEDSFNIALSTDEIVNIKSVKDVVLMLEKRGLDFSFN
ncbi:MAG: hypothetical protein GQF41_3926 [Candidatus Rifleibacterium amylolyticum]|nr:MAG: hypothetical protein GQF41_3926 [Candidatus Rifleibacterium amylolyticum]